MDAAEPRGHFEMINAGDVSTHREGARHPFMHRTQTVEYGILPSGEVCLIVDQGEMLRRQGEIIIQWDTDHAWATRSNSAESPSSKRRDRL